MTQFVLTVIGRDRAGIVADVADLVRFHGGLWERSELAELAGTFAGVVQARVPDGRADEFEADLRDLENSSELEVRARRVDPVEEHTDARELRVELLGDDRPGIVAEVSHALAELGVSISAIETETREAPMAGGLLFALHATLGVPEGVDDDQIADALEAITHEMMVELQPITSG